jgi:signal transduction histidine kinase
MAGNVKLPIQLKITLLSAFLVVIATGSYLWVALDVFKADKQALVFELNASSVRAMTAEVDAFLNSSIEKIRLVAQVSQNRALSEALLSTDSDLVSFVLAEYRRDTQKWVVLSEFTAKGGNRIDPQLAPMSRIMDDNVVVWGSSGAEVPLLSVGARVVAENSGGSLLAGILQVKAESLLKLASGRSLAEVFVVDAEGTLLLHPRRDATIGSTDFKSDPLVQQAIGSPLRLEARTYTAPTGREYLAVFSATEKGGLRVISRVDAQAAFNAVRGIVAKSVIFFALVVTLAVLLSAWLARGLTRPLRSLVEAAGKVAKGDLEVTLHTRTRDELALLTSEFNTMVLELARQRAELEGQSHELTVRVKEKTAALEEEKRVASDAQQNLLKTTRLATLGEMAGVTAHEVLNPLNNMNIRIERFRGQSLGLRQSDLQLMQQILKGWRDSYESGGISKFSEELGKRVDSGKPLLLEDLENLQGIAQDLGKSIDSFREDMDFFGTQIQRVTRIVNNMRSLSRVGGERRPLDIHKPLEDTLLTLKESAQKRKISLIQEFSQEQRDQFVIVADHDELIQVFSNLVRNAMDALMQVRESRPAEIRIRTSSQDGKVWVRIIDNGPGIDASVRARLFEPNVTTKGAAEGTGLGLSICRRIVRAFNGDVEFEDRVDGQPGTVFKVWFPRA